MYAREDSLALPSSASAQPSNLARLHTGDQVYMCVAHKSELMVVCITDPAATPIRLTPELGGKPFHITQARWVSTLTHRHLLVVTGGGGALLYSWDGSSLLKAVRLGAPEAAAAPDAGADGGLFCRGIAELDGQVAVGCSTGEVIILRTGEGRILRVSYADGFEEEIPDGDDEGVGVESLRIRWRPHAIVALAPCGGGQLALGDVRGNLMVGKAMGDNVDKLWEVESYGSAMSCLACVGDVLLGGYLSGHLRIFSISSHCALAEICAHGRAVSGLDAVGGVGEAETLRGVSVGEDTFIRVWGLQKEEDGTTKVEHLHTRRLPHHLLTGVAFTDDKANGYVTTTYDMAQLRIFLTT